MADKAEAIVTGLGGAGNIEEIEARLRAKYAQPPTSEAGGQ